MTNCAHFAVEIMVNNIYQLSNAHHTMPKKNELWGKKCPKCNRSALEHKYGKPDEPEPLIATNKITGKIIGDVKRYCHHPVQAGNALFTFCLCEIDAEDYHRAGNHAMIRNSVKQK